MRWLLALQTAIALWLEDKNVVLASSALKDSYRQSLVLDSERIKIVYLKGSFDIIQKRLEKRHDHFMSEKLLNSHDALEEPPDGIFIDVSQPPEAIVNLLKTYFG